MKIPFFDLKRIYEEQKKDLNCAAVEALESGHYILGEQGKRFEQIFAQFLGRQDSFVACNSGTDALVLSLLAAGVEPGDEVITPSHTAIPTVSAIVSIGAIPVFADIDPGSWLIDITDIERWVTPKTKALVLVHLYGNMVDVNCIRKKFAFAVIEDVAQACGSTWDGVQAGTMGDFGAFSFYPTKNLGAFGDGGGVFASSMEKVAQLRMLRNYGQRDRYHAEITRGINSRLDELQAALLTAQMPILAERLSKRIKMAEHLRQALTGLALQFPQISDSCNPAWHLFVLALESEKHRENFQAHMAKNGIETLVHYPIPAHLQKAFLKFKREALPVTEKLTKQIVSLPFNSTLTEVELAFMVKNIRDFFA